MKKTWIAILLTLCMALSLLPFGAAAAKFTDVKDGAFYAEAVDWAVNHDPQITKGVTETTFAPNQTCTRDQVVTFLWRAIGNAEKMFITNPFVDVPTTVYFYNAAVWASREKITTGKSDAKHFDPASPCTREEVATFLWRAMGQPEPTLPESPFKDVQNQSAFSYKAILWAFENGITKGKDETSFAPKSTCTRGEIVTFLYRAMHMELSVLTKMTTTHPDGSVTGYIFEYDQNGLNTRVTSLDGKQWEKHYFDARGNYIKRENAEGTFDVGGEEQKSEVTTEKDAKGRVIKETRKYEDGSVDVVKYEYDGDSSRVLVTRDGNDKLLSRSTYNENGLLTKREYFSPEDSTNPSTVSTYEYDKNDYMIHSHFVSYYDETPSWDDTKYEYDEVGHILKEVYTTSDGVNDETTYKYDFGQSGRIVSIEYTTTDKNTGDVTVEKDEFRSIVCSGVFRRSGVAIFPWDF